MKVNNAKHAQHINLCMCTCNKTNKLTKTQNTATVLFMSHNSRRPKQTALSCAKYYKLVPEHHDDVRRKSDYYQRCKSYLDTIETCQTRINLSVYPANRVWPSADHARDRQTGALLVLPITSGFSSSTTTLPSRSYNIVHVQNKAIMLNNTNTHHKCRWNSTPKATTSYKLRNSDFCSHLWQKQMPLRLFDGEAFKIIVIQVILHYQNDKKSQQFFVKF